MSQQKSPGRLMPHFRSPQPRKGLKNADQSPWRAEKIDTSHDQVRVVSRYSDSYTHRGCGFSSLNYITEIALAS